MDEITRFTLDDFPTLTEQERELLKRDAYLRSKLADRFLDSLGDWPDGAAGAVDAWREWREEVTR
jgi:hypothetical protein